MDELCEEKLSFFMLILGRGICGYKIHNRIMYILGVAGCSIATNHGIEALRRFARINGVQKVICKAKTKSREILFRKIGFTGQSNEMILEV
jgi:hypothetical protein